MYTALFMSQASVLEYLKTVDKASIECEWIVRMTKFSCWCQDE